MSDDITRTDFDDLKLPQNFDQLLRAKRVLTAVPLRKPFKHDWVRVHPTWEQPAAVLKLAGDRQEELWLLKNELVGGIPPDLVTSMTFVPTITRQGAIALWPLRSPSSRGRNDTWAETAIEIARVARTSWVQVHADQRIAAYTYAKLDQQDDPDWGDTSWAMLRELAFRAKLITSFDHPILQAVLQGK